MTRTEEILKLRGELVEENLPSLVALQKKGNKRPASKKELANARRRALKCKTAYEARAKAKEAWQFMEKREIIQVFLDREAELVNPANPVMKPLVMDKRKVPWSTLNQREAEQAIRWLAFAKTENQLKELIARAKRSRRKDKSADAEARVKAYEDAMAIWKKNHSGWKKTANKTNFNFGR